MNRTLHHVLSVVATVAFISACASSLVSAQTHEVGHWFGMWGISEDQTFRVCVNGRSAASDDLDATPTELVQLDLHGDFGGQFGPFLEQEIRVPAGEFRCVDFPWTKLRDELREEGGEPEPTGAITFQYDLRGNITRAPQPHARNIGAIMNINSLTGKVELYQNTERELVDILQTIKRDLDAGTNKGGYDDQVLTHSATPSRGAEGKTPKELTTKPGNEREAGSD